MLNLQINIFMRRGKSQWEALVSALYHICLNPKGLVVFWGICCRFVCVPEQVNSAGEEW